MVLVTFPSDDVPSWQQRSRFRPQICVDEASKFLNFICPDVDLVLEAAPFGLRRLVNTAALFVK